jgi:hypothetical protein
LAATKGSVFVYTFGFKEVVSHSVTTAFRPAENNRGGALVSFLMAACFSAAESQKSSSSVKVVWWAQARASTEVFFPPGMI